FSVTGPNGPVTLRTITRVIGGKTVVELQFDGPGIVGGSLADGNYVLSIDGSKIHNGAGAAFNGGAVQTFAFFRLFGDTDGDRDVDAVDLDAMRAALRSTDDMANYRWYLNYDGDCDVDSADYSQFLARYGRRLS